MLHNERDVRVQIGRCDPAARDLFDLNGDPDAGRLASLEFTDLTLAPQTNPQGERRLREAQVFSEGCDIHAQRFAHSEPQGKRFVRYAPDDFFRPGSQNANMAKKEKSAKHYAELRDRSGWYAAAWRDYRKLSQQEIADEVGTSKGQVSDLETGAKTRFNKDWLEKWCRALDVAAGDLIDVNPFVEEPRFAAMRRAFPGLSGGDVEALAEMASSLAKRKA